jgi:hypothetical protein
MADRRRQPIIFVLSLSHSRSLTTPLFSLSASHALLHIPLLLRIVVSWASYKRDMALLSMMATRHLMDEPPW